LLSSGWMVFARQSAEASPSRKARNPRRGAATADGGRSRTTLIGAARRFVTAGIAARAACRYGVNDKGFVGAAVRVLPA